MIEISVFRGGEDLDLILLINGCCLILQVIYDRETGRSRGFAFVTMSTTAEAEAGAQQFNGYVTN